MGSTLVAASRWQAAAFFVLTWCLIGTIVRDCLKRHASCEPIAAVTLEGDSAAPFVIQFSQFISSNEYECSDGGLFPGKLELDNVSELPRALPPRIRVPGNSTYILTGAHQKEEDAPTSPMPPEEKPTEKKIVFSFSKTPWDVALTRFAELAELQLILNFKPPGTFDYSSTKAYTIPEALDVLNEVLIAEGFVVLRNDRFLTLAALDKPLPLNQVPTVSEEQLPQHGRNEFVTVAKRLKFADASTIEPEVEK